MLYFCYAVAAFSLSQFQMFLEARGLKTTLYQAASLKVVQRLQFKTTPRGNSSRVESMTMQDVSELLLENNMPEIQESEFSEFRMFPQ